MKIYKIILGIPLLLLILIGAVASFIHVGVVAGYMWGIDKFEKIAKD